MEDSDNVNDVDIQNSEQDFSEDGIKAADDTPDNFFVPEEYKNCGWVKNIKSQNDLWKTLDGAQKVIGRKTIGIPNFDRAAESEIVEFYSKTRPQNKSDYMLDDDFSENEKESIRNVFFENGLNKNQAVAVVNEFKRIVKDSSDKNYGAEGLELLLSERFGSNWKTETSKISNVLKSTLSEEMLKEINENMTNSAVVGLYDITKSLLEKFGAKDSDFAIQKTGTNNLPKMGYDEFYKKMKEADGKYNSYELKKQLMESYYGG